MPDAYVTIFLALLELYTHGGIYVDLTTFFVRPLPTDLDGFVAGGQGQGVDGGTAGDCSTPTTGGRRQRPFVMQVCSKCNRGPVCVCGNRRRWLGAFCFSCPLFAEGNQGVVILVPAFRPRV